MKSMRIAQQSACERWGETPREEGVLTRVSARIGMAFSTLMDSTTGHIAEMMIEGSNMGITDMTRLLNTYQGTTSAEEGVRLAREVVNFEERNLEMMKRFL
jgi:hypothetical protein